VFTKAKRREQETDKGQARSRQRTGANPYIYINNTQHNDAKEDGERWDGHTKKWNRCFAELWNPDLSKDFVPEFTYDTHAQLQARPPALSHVGIFFLLCPLETRNAKQRKTLTHHHTHILFDVTALSQLSLAVPFTDSVNVLVVFYRFVKVIDRIDWLIDWLILLKVIMQQQPKVLLCPPLEEDDIIEHDGDDAHAVAAAAAAAATSNCMAVMSKKLHSNFEKLKRTSHAVNKNNNYNNKRKLDNEHAEDGTPGNVIDDSNKRRRQRLALETAALVTSELERWKKQQPSARAGGGRGRGGGSAAGGGGGGVGGVYMNDGNDRLAIVVNDAEWMNEEMNSYT
jgi:hypothetical protein